MAVGSFQPVIEQVTLAVFSTFGSKPGTTRPDCQKQRDQTLLLKAAETLL